MFDMSSDLSDRLKEVMRKEGLSIADLARMTNIPYNSVKDWVAGVRNPREAARKKLADALNVSEAFLLGLTAHANVSENEFEITSGERTRRVPYWGTVPSTSWEFPGEDVSMISVSNKVPEKGHIAVTVAGDSLEPRVHHNQTVIFKLDDVPNEGLLTLARTKEKRLIIAVSRFTKEGWMLVPVDSKFESIDASDCRIIGWAIGIEDFPAGGIRI